MTGGVAALVAQVGHDRLPIMVALAAVALLLDGVDGPVAKRTGTVSALGPRFDGEIDALLIAVLSVQVAAGLGGWVLAIGAMRYAFLESGWLAAWLRDRLPLSFARKAIAELQAVALLVATAGITSRPVAAVAVATALGLLLWSFGRDVRWLWRHRRDRLPRTDGAGRRGSGTR